jgi:hypothetical protein
MCNNILKLVTIHNIVLHKANSHLGHVNRATYQSLSFVNLTSELLLIHETHTVYETYIYCMNMYCIFNSQILIILYVCKNIYRDGE